MCRCLHVKIITLQMTISKITCSLTSPPYYRFAETHVTCKLTYGIEVDKNAGEDQLSNYIAKQNPTATHFHMCLHHCFLTSGEALNLIQNYCFCNPLNTVLLLGLKYYFLLPQHTNKLPAIATPIEQTAVNGSITFNSMHFKLLHEIADLLCTYALYEVCEQITACKQTITSTRWCDKLHPHLVISGKSEYPKGIHCRTADIHQQWN